MYLKINLLTVQKFFLSKKKKRKHRTTYDFLLLDIKTKSSKFCKYSMIYLWGWRKFWIFS